MSAQGHATAADTDAAHHDHYEGIPADKPGPGEPHTPLWLPLFGISLLLVALLAFALTRPAGKTGAELAKEASPAPVASAAPAASAVPAAAAPGATAGNPRIRNLPPHVASALAEARGAAKTAAEDQGNVAAPGSAPAPRPRPAGAQPAPNPPHGAPGHVH